MSRKQLISEFQYRVTIMPDIHPYEVGDAEDQAKCDEIAERDGVWGYVVERRKLQAAPCTTCGHVDNAWDDVDSCFAFLGNDTSYMRDCIMEHLPVGVDVPVFEKHDHGPRRQIDTYTRKPTRAKRRAGK